MKYGLLFNPHFFNRRDAPDSYRELARFWLRAGARGEYFGSRKDAKHAKSMNVLCLFSREERKDYAKVAVKIYPILLFEELRATQRIFVFDKNGGPD